MTQNNKPSLYDIADLWNSFKDEPDMDALNAMIEAGGYEDDCHEQWRICHSDTQEIRLEDDLMAIVYERED